MMARKVPGTWSAAQADEIERLKQQRDDLLAALRELVCAANQYADPNGHDDRHVAIAIIAARAVITKATGEKP